MSDCPIGDLKAVLTAAGVGIRQRLVMRLPGPARSRPAISTPLPAERRRGRKSVSQHDASSTRPADLMPSRPHRPASHRHVRGTARGSGVHHRRHAPAARSASHPRRRCDARSQWVPAGRTHAAWWALRTDQVNSVGDVGSKLSAVGASAPGLAVTAVLNTLAASFRMICRSGCDLRFLDVRES